jgi:glutaredoxin-like protein NrdH
MVTVYTLPSCVQCESTKKYLSKLEVDFKTIDLSEDEIAMDLVKGLGYQAAPVVVFGDDHWSGFRPDKLDALTN